MLHVDDLVQPRPEKITGTRRLVSLRPHRPLRSMRSENHDLRRAGIQKRQTKSQGSRPSNTKTLQSQLSHSPKTRLAVNGLAIVHERLLTEAHSKLRSQRAMRADQAP